MIACHWLSPDLENKKFKGLPLNVLHDSEETALIYKRELHSCCWTQVKLSNCFQFHVSHSRHAWNTAVFSHKLWRGILAACWQGYHRFSSSPKSFSELVPCWDFCIRCEGGTRCEGTWSSAATNLCGLSSLTGAKLLYPVSLWGARAVPEHSVVVCALRSTPSSVWILSYIAVLVTVIVTTKTGDFETVSACASATWLLVLSSIYTSVMGKSRQPGARYCRFYYLIFHG